MGFNVYRAAATPVSITGTPLEWNDAVSGNSFHDGAAANGQFWYYVVQSVDSIGQHSEAHSVSAKPTAPVVGPTYQVTLSGSADRSAGQDLNGLVVSGDAYVFTSPATSVKTVQFWLDDPTMSGPVTRNETTTPYDFIGGSPAAASPYDTHVLADGVHTITQKVTTTANVVVTTTATFKVVNSQLPPPAPTGIKATAGNGVVDLSWDAKERHDLWRQPLPQHLADGQPFRHAAQRSHPAHRYVLPRHERQQRDDVLLRALVGRRHRSAHRGRHARGLAEPAWGSKGRRDPVPACAVHGFGHDERDADRDRGQQRRSTRSPSPVPLWAAVTRRCSSWSALPRTR